MVPQAVWYILHKNEPKAKSLQLVEAYTFLTVDSLGFMGAQEFVP
jgi:hypothetical protein